MSNLPVRPEVQRLHRYVPGKPIAEVQKTFGLTDVVKLASNENPIGPSPLALQVLAEAAADSHRYPDAQGPDLQAALSEHDGIPAGWIFLGNGSDEILRLLAASYLQVGDRVVLPACSFPNYRAVSTLFGAAICEVELRDESMNLGAMGAESAGARLIFLCRPNNPTGAVFAEAEFRAFMQRVPPETLVVLDQAYHEFDSSPFDSIGLLQQHANLVLTRTFSKAHGLAGLRIGYGLAQPAIWEPLLTVREPFSVNRLAQAAALAALHDRAHLAETLAVTRAGKGYLERVCTELNLSFIPSEGNFLLIDLGRPAVPVYEVLLREGVIVRPGDSFGRPTCLRVTIGTDLANQRFAQALAKALRG